MGKGKRVDVYLEVKEEEGAYIFLMKQVPVLLKVNLQHYGFGHYCLYATSFGYFNGKVRESETNLDLTQLVKDIFAVR